MRRITKKERQIANRIAGLNGSKKIAYPERLRTEKEVKQTLDCRLTD